MTVALRPFKIGPLEIESPVVLAALAGYSDLAYRTVCRRLGAPFCATEVMLDKCLLAGAKARRRLACIDADDHPVAGQIMGNDAATMAAAAACVADLGFDVIDLNFACPVHKALRRRRGGYLMRQPAVACEIVRAVVAAVDCPVTVKLRRSFDSDDDACEAFWRITEGAFDAGVAAVCVHARSVEQKYTGRADWEFLTQVKQRFTDRVIIGSGDVLTPAEAIAMLEQTRVDAVTAARGVLGNPWFFRQVQDIASGRPPYRPTLCEQREVIESHFAMACDLHGPSRGPKIMRKFGIKYAHSHPAPKDVRIAFVAVKTPQQWHDVLEHYYSGQTTECGQH